MIRTRLRKARNLKGWTQKRLAEESGISQPLIAKYEMGHKPSAKNLNRLCAAFDLTPEYFNGTLSKVVDQEYFDEVQFSQMLKKTNSLSLQNKMMVKAVLARAIYFQEIEDRGIKNSL